MEQVQINSWYTPGEPFTLYGQKIKIEGDDPNCGVFFVDAANPDNAVKQRVVIENNPSSIRGIVPYTDFGDCRIEIRTQYTGSGSNTLKTPRTITSPFILERG